MWMRWFCIFFAFGVAGFVQADKIDQWILEYDGLLENYVQPGVKKGIKSNLVDYEKLRKSGLVPKLKTSLKTLPAVDKLEQKKQLAFWLNVYNFLAMAKVVENPKINSLKDLSGWFDPVWKQDAGTVSRKKYSLDDIEHEIIRKQFKEPRIHAALVCAALSCPNLRREAYISDKLDAQLDEQLKSFLSNNKKGMKVDDNNQTIYLSKVFKWFAEDFEKNPKEWLIKKAFIPRKVENYHLKYLEYDWELNRQ